MTEDIAKREWYLLTCKPRQDDRAEENLIRQNYEVYRPIAKRLHRHRGKMLVRTESLFPRYIFIHLDDGLADNWAPIRSTYGVSAFVRANKEILPPPVPEKLILDLKGREKILGDKAFDLDHFHKGQKVIITDGPFKGLEAVFDKYDGEERSMILLKLLETTRPSKMTISPALLYAA